MTNFRPSRFLALASLALLLYGCTAGPRRGGAAAIPKAAPGFEKFVPGTGAVRLGMTESELTTALATQPERKSAPEQRRESLTFKLAATESGQTSGYAIADFIGGPLVRIQFVGDNQSILRDIPPIDAKLGESLARFDLALKLIRKEMSLTEVEALAGGAGRLVSWTLQQAATDPAADEVRTTRVWQLKGKQQVLIMEAVNGVPEQPLLRDLGQLTGGYNAK